MAVHNYAVAASADDARETGGTVTINTNSIVITGAAMYIGLSFPTAAAPIAQGETITLAELTYNIIVAEAQADLIWKGHKVVNSGQYVASTNDVSSRYSGAPTTASVTDNAVVPVGSRTIAVTAIVQELVNQAGWTNTSRIGLIGKGATGAVDMQIRAIDFGSGGATLTVVTAGGVTIKTTYYQAMMSQ